MPPEIHRRTLLSAVAGLSVTGVAGCSGTADRPLGSLPAPPPEPITDLDGVKVRVEDPVALFRTEESADEGFDQHYDLITTPADLDALRFESDIEGAVELEEFTATVDLDSHSVLLYQETVKSCFTHHLVQVAYGDGNLDTEFCRSLRPADVACDSDGESTVGYAIALPLADIELGTFGWGTGRCDETIRPVNVSGSGRDGGEQ